MKILDNQKTALFDVDLKGLTWLKAKEVTGRTIRVDALGVNHKSKYGAQPFLVSGSMGVNLPKYLTARIDEILLDAESIDAIKSGKITADITEYQPKNGNAPTVEVTFKAI